MFNVKQIKNEVQEANKISNEIFSNRNLTE